MKKKKLAVVLLMLGGAVLAQDIDLATARQVGAYYLSVASDAKQFYDPDSLELTLQFDNTTLCVPALYVFNAEEGFVVVSASECVEPVLAYSPSGYIDTVGNPALQAFLEGYARVVSENQNAGVAASRNVRTQWDEVYNHTLFIDNAKAGTLVKSTWGQGSKNNPTYNVMCPLKDGKHCITGCVATALGAIIHYWKYPVKGGTAGNSTAMCQWDGQTIKYKFMVDSNKFLYDSMPDKLSKSSSWEAKRAIGKLLFACGVTVGMNWGLDGSSATSSKVPEALWRYFGYSQNATYLKREGISDDEWNRLLHHEIEENGRPVYYRATSPGSTGTDANHAFVVCGVSGSSQNRYWVNWGWSGSSNGFFTLTPMSTIERASSYTFSSGHAMIHHICPMAESILENGELQITPAYPNPATEHITIPVDLTFNAILTVFAMDGSVVHHAIVPAGTKVYDLSLQGFAAGTYIYRLNGTAYRFSVVK